MKKKTFSKFPSSIGFNSTSIASQFPFYKRTRNLKIKFFFGENFVIIEDSFQNVGNFTISENKLKFDLFQILRWSKHKLKVKKIGHKTNLVWRGIRNKEKNCQALVDFRGLFHIQVFELNFRSKIKERFRFSNVEKNPRICARQMLPTHVLQ